MSVVPVHMIGGGGSDGICAALCGAHTQDWLQRVECGWMPAKYLKRPSSLWRAATSVSLCVWFFRPLTWKHYYLFLVHILWLIILAMDAFIFGMFKRSNLDFWVLKGCIVRLPHWQIGHHMFQSSLVSVNPSNDFFYGNVIPHCIKMILFRSNCAISFSDYHKWSFF